jgi:heme/copper-type cytochrome/quinol oxidase subunit 4
MKIVNFVLGLATAIILGALINLGIKAFYPEPAYPSYPAYPIVAPQQCASSDANCLGAQQQKQTEIQNKYSDDLQAYQAAEQVYNRNIFIIANLIGIVIFAIGFWLVFISAIAARGVPIGIMVAGLWSIIYGYGRGWDSTNDQLKFFIGLVIALLVIGGSAWLMQRHAKKLDVVS